MSLKTNIISFLKDKSKRPLLISLLILCAGAGILLYQHSELKEEKKEFVALQKDKMEDELIELQEEYSLQVSKIQKQSGYGEQFVHLSSDSLLEQLGSERAKVERLVEELKAVRESDTKMINKLSKEVRNLRKVLKTYVQQVDSLQKINSELKKENKQVKQDIAQIKKETSSLRQEKQELSSQLAIAAHLEASNIVCKTLNKRGRKTGRINRIRTIEINFTLQKNNTAKVGKKTIYAYIVTPFDQALFNSGASFSYEGETLHTEVYKTINYGGDNLPVTLYWNINESLIKGEYKIYLFSDNELIGEKNLILE